MPPQRGVFALPQHSHAMTAGPSHAVQVGALDDPKRKRKEIAARLGKEISDRREDTGRHYAETIAELNSVSFHLSTRPEMVPAYQLRLYPLSLERSALLASATLQERYALESIQTAYEEERAKVEEEWKKGRERIRERLMDGIEERRRRAREEKDGEGAAGDATLDAQSRPHITRKLRKLAGGTSPPPTPQPNATGANGGILSIASGPITTGPFLNPHSLSVDELPSPFPLPLTATHLNASANYGPAATTTNGRRRPKGAGRETQAVGGLGKSIACLSTCKEAEIEHDLGEIRRGNKRRRAAAAGNLAAKA